MQQHGYKYFARRHRLPKVNLGVGEMEFMFCYLKVSLVHLGIRLICLVSLLFGQVTHLILRILVITKKNKFSLFTIRAATECHQLPTLIMAFDGKKSDNWSCSIICHYFPSNG